MGINCNVIRTGVSEFVLTIYSPPLYFPYIVILFIQGVKAIHCPYTGIVDWGRVARQYASNVEERGGTVVTEHEVGGSHGICMCNF